MVIGYRFNDNGFGAPAVLFENGEGLQVTFNAAPPLNVDFDYVGVSAGEDQVVLRSSTWPFMPAGISKCTS